MTLPISSSQHTLKKSYICPFLGLADDAQTALAFPSDWNTCHHCKPLRSIQLDHQRRYCLSPNHKECAAFIQAPGQAMPRELRNRYQVRAQAGNRVWKISLALGFLALVAGLSWAFNDRIGSFLQANFLDPFAGPPASPASVPVSRSPSPESTPSGTPGAPTMTGTSTRNSPFFSEGPMLSTTVAAQVTPTITRIPYGMGDLIGINYLFRIHRVKRGENLDLLAQINGTSVAAIMAVNYHLTTPLWVQQIIILPVNQTDVSDLPPFEPYRVTENIAIERLAEQLGVDADQLQYYNDLGTSEHLIADEWIVVPREE